MSNASARQRSSSDAVVPAAAPRGQPVSRKVSKAKAFPARTRRPRTGLAKGMLVRLSPTKEQATILHRWQGACRWTWNWALAQQHTHYASTQTHLGTGSLSKALTQAMAIGVDPVSGRDITWLRDLPRTSLTCTLRHLKAAWQAFFDGMSGKRPDKPGKPRFKKYGDTRKAISFQVDPRHASRIDAVAGTINLPIIGAVSATFSEPVPGEATQLTVYHQGGQWWLAIALVNVPEKAARRLRDWSVLTFAEALEQDSRCRHFDDPLDPTGFCSIDASVPHAAIATADGNTAYACVTPYERACDDKKRFGRRRLQRAFSRKQQKQIAAYNRVKGQPDNTPLPKGVHLKQSRRQRHLKNRIGKVDLDLRNAKLDRLHKFTTTVVREHHTVIVETLQLSAMGQALNAAFRRRFHEAGVGELFRQLKYKCQWQERTLIEVNRWFASSKRCSNPACHQKNTSLKLSDRAWTCPHCHVTWNRDENAAYNLWQEGQRLAAERHHSTHPESIHAQAILGYADGSSVNRCEGEVSSPALAVKRLGRGGIEIGKGRSSPPAGVVSESQKRSTSLRNAPLRAIR